jgi:hypothetical protein
MTTNLKSFVLYWAGFALFVSVGVAGIFTVDRLLALVR